MFGQKQLTPLILIACTVLLPTSGAVKAQGVAKEELDLLKKTSDSVTATLARALSKRDSALLVSVFSDEVSIMMLGQARLRGKTEIMKQTPQFFEKVGGWQLTTSRQILDPIKNVIGYVKEAGKFVLTEPSERKTGRIWRGIYLAHWRLQDSKWVLLSLLLSKE
jgi:hypothetical protein